MARATPRMVVRGCVAGLLATLLVACSALEDLVPALERLTDLVGEEEELTERLGDAISRLRSGTDVTLAAQVEASFQYDIDGSPLHGWGGTWTHQAVGTLADDGLWLTETPTIEGQGDGFSICYDDDGSTWQTDWASPLSWPDGEPQFELVTDGDQVLVLYAVPATIGYLHPGARACASGPPTDAGPQDELFTMYLLDGERAAGADTSTRPGVQDGIVVFRIPVDELATGGSWSGTLTTDGHDDGAVARLAATVEVTAD